jgi:hypothetical protein
MIFIDFSTFNIQTLVHVFPNYAQFILIHQYEVLEFNFQNFS